MMQIRSNGETEHIWIEVMWIWSDIGQERYLLFNGSEATHHIERQSARSSDLGQHKQERTAHRRWQTVAARADR
jgi:hypothetical protein